MSRSYEDKIARPDAVFERPASVLEDATLDMRQKRSVLEAWRTQCERSGIANRARAVDLALMQLSALSGAEDAAHS